MNRQHGAIRRLALLLGFGRKSLTRVMQVKLQVAVTYIAFVNLLSSFHDMRAFAYAIERL